MFFKSHVIQITSLKQNNAEMQVYISNNYDSFNENSAYEDLQIKPIFQNAV